MLLYVSVSVCILSEFIFDYLYTCKYKVYISRVKKTILLFKKPLFTDNMKKKKHSQQLFETYPIFHCCLRGHLYH